jgi:hypothetical protein
MITVPHVRVAVSLNSDNLLKGGAEAPCGGAVWCGGNAGITGGSKLDDLLNAYQSLELLDPDMFGIFGRYGRLSVTPEPRKLLAPPAVAWVSTVRNVLVPPLAVACPSAVENAVAFSTNDRL